MRKLITALAASALLTVGVCGAGIAQASTTHPTAHVAALAQPGGGCSNCKI
jgi:hypothetical protein